MKRGAVILVMVALVSFWALSPTSDVRAQGRNEYTVGGASLLFSLIKPWSEAYTKQAPQCVPRLLGSKTGQGYRGWIAGEVDIVAASRELIESEKKQALEKGKDPQSKVLGYVALAVVVNSVNPVKTLTLEQLRKVFSGEVTNWRDVGGTDEEIIVTTRAVPETGAGVLFQEEVLKGGPYAQSSLIMPLYSTTARLVGNKAGAIGYIPTSDPAYQQIGIKPVAIKRGDSTEPMSPSDGVAKTTEYPVHIPFILVWDGKSPKAGCLSGFADFAEKQVK